MVGMFVASGLCIAVIAIIWLGMSRFLQKGQYYGAYFNESVQGLDVDSPVKYRGVSIGRVDSIRVAPDSELIEVVLKIETGQALSSDIVAQLKVVGITGAMFVELDRKKPGEPDRSPTLNFPTEYPIVASMPSDISELLRGIDDVLNQIRSLDLGGISDNVKLALRNISQAIEDANVKGISNKIQSTLDSANQSIADANVKGISKGIESSIQSAHAILDNKKWDQILASVEQASQSLDSLMNKANRSLNSLESALSRVEGVVEEKETTIKSAIDEFKLAMENANVFLEKGTNLVSGTNETLDYLRRHLLVTGQNLERASENLDRLIELLADHPPQLLFGEPPPRRNIEMEIEE